MAKTLEQILTVEKPEVVKKAQEKAWYKESSLF